MLPTARPLTAETAARWVRLAVPQWVPKVILTVGWAVALATAFAGDNRLCTPADPAICGPDQAFAVWIVVCLATPVLLLWMPLAGCATGIAVGLTDLARDDGLAGQIAFGTHALACALVAGWLLRSSARQDRLALDAAGGATAVAPGPLRVDYAHDGQTVVTRCCAGLLVVVGAGLFAWYRHDAGIEQRHLARAVQVTARIDQAGRDDNEILVTVTSANGPAGDLMLDVDDTAAYRVGDTTPLLLDPNDSTWMRLAAEPQDSTGWESAGIGALALALALALRDAAGWRARRRLSSGEHPALAVRLIPDDDNTVLVLPAAGEGPGADLALARLDVTWQPATASAAWTARPGWTNSSEGGVDFGGGVDPDDVRLSAWSDRPADAVLIGNLRAGGWVLLLTNAGLLVPWTPVRPLGVRSIGREILLRRRMWFQRVEAADGPDGRRRSRRSLDNYVRAYPDSLPGRPIAASALRAEPALPYLARSPARVRRVWLLSMIATTVAVPIVVLTVGLGDGRWVFTTVLVGQLLLTEAGPVVHRIRFTQDHLEIVSDRWVHEVPWEQLRSVRRCGDKLSLAWRSGTGAVVGPFAEPDLELAAAGGEPADRLEQLGAAMLLLRDRALAGDPPDRTVRRRPSPAWYFLAGYALVVAATFWTVLSR